MTTFPMTLTREQIEAFRQENVIHPSGDSGIEAWAIEENMILNTLCDYYLSALDTGTAAKIVARAK